MIDVNPIDHRLMIDRKQPPDAPKAIAFQIEFERHRAGLGVIAERMWRGRVLAATELTLKALATRAVEAAFNLSFGCLAMWASLHTKCYNIVMADLDSPVC